MKRLLANSAYKTPSGDVPLASIAGFFRLPYRTTGVPIFSYVKFENIVRELPALFKDEAYLEEDNRVALQFNRATAGFIILPDKKLVAFPMV